MIPFFFPPRLIIVCLFLCLTLISSHFQNFPIFIVNSFSFRIFLKETALLTHVIHPTYVFFYVHFFFLEFLFLLINFSSFSFRIYTFHITIFTNKFQMVFPLFSKYFPLFALSLISTFLCIYAFSPSFSSFIFHPNRVFHSSDFFSFFITTFTLNLLFFFSFLSYNKYIYLLACFFSMHFAFPFCYTLTN